MSLTPIRTFIVDDEPDGRANIKSFLAMYFPDMVVAGEASSVSEAITTIPPDINLLFLDIQLPDGTGFDILDRLPSLTFNVIFTTAHDGFAIRAFRYNAVDYLLKPIDPDEFQQAVQKTQDHINLEVVRKQLTQLINTANTNNFDRITLNTSDGHVFAHTRDITRIETYGNYTFVYLAAGDRLLVSRNMKEFEEMLPEPDFFRVHQSHIVNTGFVQKVTKEDGDHAVMTDGIKIPVSRRRKEEFLNIVMRNQRSA
jgi:two-component system LytT family response regulator